MKFKYIVRYEYSSDECDVGHYRIKVKVTAGVQWFSHLPQYKLLGLITQLWCELGSLY